MPRQTSQSRTRVPSDVYQTAPSVRSQVVPRTTPVIGSSRAGTEQLGNIIGNFFGGMSDALKSVQKTQMMLERNEIERQNQQQQVEAAVIALEGGELTPDQEQDWDYITPYNKTKAAIAVAEDSADFQTNVLPTLGLDADHIGALRDYTLERIKGAENEQFARFYQEGMLRANLEAIQKHQTNLHIAERAKLWDEKKAEVAFRLRNGQIESAEDLLEIVQDFGALGSAADVQQNMANGVAAIMNIAALHQKLPLVVSLLQQRVPPTEDNPKGLSWAERFPDGFQAAWKEALSQEDQQFRLDLDSAIHRVNMALAEEDLVSAKIQLDHIKELFGADHADVRRLELAVTKALTAAAGDTAARHMLLTMPEDGIPADPEIVSKYGYEVLKQVFDQAGPVAAAGRLRAWGSVPEKWTQWVEANVTRSTAPDKAAEFLTTYVIPLYHQDPELALHGLSDDAEFVVRYVAEAGLINQPILDATVEVLAVRDQVRKTGTNPRAIKLWDETEENAEIEFRDELREDVSDVLDGAVVTDPYLDGIVIPLIQRKTMFYRATMAHEKAVEKATQEVLEGLAKRTLKLPAPDGTTVAVHDVTPDVAAKWQPVTIGGETFDPVEEFRADSERPELAFIAGGEPLGLKVGPDTMSDGAFDVEAEGQPWIQFRPGQTITYEEVVGTDVVTGGLGVAVGTVKRTEERTLKLPNDELAMVNMLTELFGDTGFRISKVSDDLQIWRLQYVPPGARLPEIEELAAKKAQENEEARSRPSIVDRISARFKRAMAQDNATREALWLNRPWIDGKVVVDGSGIRVVPSQERAAKDLARSIIAGLQDKGMLPPSTGTTKPIPEVQTVDEALAYIESEKQRYKMSKGNLPLEPRDTRLDQRYVMKRYEFLKLNEGKRNAVYHDTEGHPTIGIGFNLDAPHVVQTLKDLGLDVKALREGRAAMSDDEIAAAFEILVNEAEKVVSTRIKVPLTTPQRLALVSMAYQHPDLIGPNITAAINRQDWEAALNEILHRSNISKNRGIQNRREREAAMFRRGVAVA